MEGSALTQKLSYAQLFASLLSLVTSSFLTFTDNFFWPLTCAAGRTVAILTLTPLTDISVLSRSALVFVTKDSFVSLDTNFNNKINVFKQWWFLYPNKHEVHNQAWKTPKKLIGWPIFSNESRVPPPTRTSYQIISRSWEFFVETVLVTMPYTGVLSVSLENERVCKVEL